MLGVGISLINMRTALDQLDRWIASRERQYVSVCTVHTVMECRRQPDLRRIVNAAGMTTPDGMPLVWLSRLAGHHDVSRVYGPDLMLAEMQSSVARGHKHFFYGGRAGVAGRLADVMRRRFPGLQIVGTLTPPLATAAELCNPETAGSINRAAPDVVWVSKERLAAVLRRDGKLHGAPDLVIEVLSPGAKNERRDREAKLKLYARRGVREYWIINWHAPAAGGSGPDRRRRGI